MNYAEFVPILINAMKKQQKQIENIRKENEQLKTRLDKLEK